MPSKYVMAWDPGGTTGLCVGLPAPTEPSGFQVVDSAIVPWHNRFSKIRAYIDRYRPSHTIVEPFVLYRHKAQDQVGSHFPSAQVIGIIEAYLFMTGVAMPVYQGAFLIAGKPPVQVLPEHKPLLFKGTTPADTEHALDAYKHLRYWMQQQRHQTHVGRSK